MGPATLAQVLRLLTIPSHPNVLVGLEKSDDAAVYQLTDDLALVQTVDFFPPIVDDPATFGAIAAANALSDVYAMGGRPILALAIAGFPEDFAPHVIAAVLQGGADKVMEAGAVVAGGHTVIDREPKYGLCVTGLIDPARITTKANAQPGDVLVLTKPIGTGVITTAHKRGIACEEALAAAVASMLRLNKCAAEVAADLVPHSATDITGFGLLGHAAEVSRNSDVGLVIAIDRVPLLANALAYARQGCRSGGQGRNADYLLGDGMVQFDDGCEEAHTALLFDPQTSGGLLFAFTADAAAAFQARMMARGEPCWVIGEVIGGRGVWVRSGGIQLPFARDPGMKG